MGAQDRIVTTVHATDSLTRAQWDEIWILTQEYFDVERAHAEAELRKRPRVALVRMNGALLGMAAIEVYTESFRGRPVTVISTTHVLLRENWRGRNLLQKLGFRTFLAERLPYFMVPRFIRVVPELPKTPTQKVQKAELRRDGVTADSWDREVDRTVVIKRERLQ